MELKRVQQILSQKPVEASDVMHCFLGLRNLEIDVYFYLLKEPATVKDVAKGLGRNRSTIQRAIQNLVNQGFANRRMRTLRKGGYNYVYEATNLATLKQTIRDKLNAFYDQIVLFLDRMFVATLEEK